MRQMIKGLLAAFAVMTAGAAPAMACGFGGCCAAYSPCQNYVAPVYAAPTYTYSYGTGCATCGGWGYARLAEPTTQYYYVNQGPTYSGPGSFAPYPAYEENAIPGRGYRYGYGYDYHYYRRPWHNSYVYAPRHYAYRNHWGHEGYWGGHPLVRRYY